MSPVPLTDLAPTIRSKNAGVDEITFDVIFRDRETYEHVKTNDLITKADVAERFGISPSRISTFTYFDPATALTFTIRRDRPSGSPGERDVMGAQAYPPLYDLELPPPPSDT